MSFLSSYEQAKALAGADFDARIAVGTVTVRLDTVTKLGAGVRPQGDSFSLVFSGPVPSAFGQGTITLVHPTGDEAEQVFVVPIGREGERMLYEAVFN